MSVHKKELIKSWTVPDPADFKSGPVKHYCPWPRVTRPAPKTIKYVGRAMHCKCGAPMGKSSDPELCGCCMAVVRPLIRRFEDKEDD